MQKSDLVIPSHSFSILSKTPKSSILNKKTNQAVESNFTIKHMPSLVKQNDNITKTTRNVLQSELSQG